MTIYQLSQLSDALTMSGYPHEVSESIIGSYHTVKCLREKISPEICKLLVNAPDFDGIIREESFTTWGALKIIVFTYKATEQFTIKEGSQQPAKS